MNLNFEQSFKSFLKKKVKEANEVEENAAYFSLKLSEKNKIILTTVAGFHGSNLTKIITDILNEKVSEIITLTEE